MNIRGQLKDELKQKDPKNRVFYQHQSFAETAVNALEQRTLLDIDSEPYVKHFYLSLNSFSLKYIDGILVIRVLYVL
jgi:hypothetical protein